VIESIIMNNEDLKVNYTDIYNYVLESLVKDGIDSSDIQIKYAKRITDAVWDLGLAINSQHQMLVNTRTTAIDIINKI